MRFVKDECQTEFPRWLDVKWCDELAMQHFIYWRTTLCVCWTTLNVIYWLIFSVRVIREYISPSSVPTPAPAIVIIIIIATITFIISGRVFKDHIEWMFRIREHCDKTKFVRIAIRLTIGIQFELKLLIGFETLVSQVIFVVCIYARCANEWMVSCSANYLCKSRTDVSIDACFIEIWIK